jgi:hypothetical protein
MNEDQIPAFLGGSYTYNGSELLEGAIAQVCRGVAVVDVHLLWSATCVLPCAECLCVASQVQTRGGSRLPSVMCVCVCGNVRRAQGGCPPKPEFTKGQKYIDEPAAE